MHTKDIALILLVIFALALIADDSGSIKSKFSELGDKSEVTGAVVGISEVESAEEALRAAETASKSGNTKFSQATNSLKNLDWDECISSCLVARDYYKIASNKFDDAIDELDQSKSESKNKVLGAFIDKSINYYSCLNNLVETKIETCNSMELACLAYSHEEDEEGNTHKEIVDANLEILTESETECETILEDVQAKPTENQNEVKETPDNENLNNSEE